MTTTWHGVTLDDRSAAMMDEVQALVNASASPFTITATQGSYSTSEDASAGTHSGGGAIDLGAVVLTSDQRTILVEAMRQVGFAAWLRTPAQFDWPYHVHGIAVGCPDLSGPAQNQVTAYFQGRNGLASNAADDGPRDWVGITWEDYQAGNPPNGGEAPVAYAPGNLAGTYGILPDATVSGSPGFTGGSAFYASEYEDPPSVTLHLDAGDSCFLALGSDWLIPQLDDLVRGYWIVRMTGGGSLDVSDAWDEGFAYPAVTPTWVPETLAGTTDGVSYYTVDPTMLDEDHLANDGQPLILLTCTSGSVDITWVGMRVETVAGYYVEADGFTWSGTIAATTQEPPYDTSSPFSTFYFTIVDGVGIWAVDGTPTLGIIPGDLGEIAEWVGSASALTEADDARAGSLADFQPLGTHLGPDAFAALLHVPAHSVPEGPIPEMWNASLSESIEYATSPTKALIPGTPTPYTQIPGYAKSGFEYLDDDTQFLGWHFYGGSHDGVSDYIETTGDATEVTLYLYSFTDDVDTTNAWFEDGSGFEVTTASTLDSPPDGSGNFPDPYLAPIPDTMWTTSGNFLVIRLSIARRLTSELDQFTPEFGYPANANGTSAGIAHIRESDGEHVASTLAAAVFRMPAWRYKIPNFTVVPAFPPGTDSSHEPDVTVTWLRQRQRNDGLGSSVIRAKGASSRQMSLRQRGYR